MDKKQTIEFIEAIFGKKIQSIEHVQINKELALNISETLFPATNNTYLVGTLELSLWTNAITGIPRMDIYNKDANSSRMLLYSSGAFLKENVFRLYNQIITRIEFDSNGASGSEIVFSFTGFKVTI